MESVTRRGNDSTELGIEESVREKRWEGGRDGRGKG